MGKQGYINTGDTNRMKNLVKQLAEHGTLIDEVPAASWARGATIKRERVLVVMEMLYQKAVNGDGNITAGMAYLDRILGKPKESLTLEGDNILQRYTDDELVDKITGIIDRARAGGAPGPGG